MPVISTKELIRELRSQGWEVDQTTQGHYRATPPDRSKPIVHMGSESGDFRAVRNNIARLRKSGFIPPWDEPSSPGDDMSNGSNGESTRMPLDYLEKVLELYAHVHKLPADQILFTKEADGRWLMTIPNDTVLATGDHGKGRQPEDACRELFQSLRGVIRQRIEELQALEAQLGDP